MKHFSLSEFNSVIKKVLEKELSPSYWIIAEISDININNRGHCYLELVEKTDNQIIAKTRATIWSYTYSNLSSWFQKMTGESLKNGMKILFNASMQYHEVFGLSLNIKDIDANYTIGERAIKRQQVILQLENDGVLDMNKMLELPLVPMNIAVISSSTAAGYGDFLNQLKSNQYHYSFNIELFQSIMQGDSAPTSIIDALHKINSSNQNFDLVVLIRGGGSQLDLDCFDDYELNSHLAQIPLPVVTGIGHERDTTIADLVANQSLKTPTAVAEFIISGVRGFEERIEENFEHIANYGMQLIENAKSNLKDVTYKLANVSHQNFNNHSKQLLKLEQKVKFTAMQRITYTSNRLELISERLQFLLPEEVLKRGYTLTSINNKRIKLKPQLGDIMVTETLNSKIKSTINEVNSK